MTMYGPPQLSVGHMAEAIGTLRQLQQQIEAVRHDFMTQGDGPQLPAEVTQLHLRRETVLLERQIRQALIHAFGEQSRQVRHFRESGFAAATAGSLAGGLVNLDAYIFDLEQTRLHVLESNGSPPVAGLDPVTDLYTEPMLRRFLEHEVAWSQRHGDPFGLLLLRLPGLRAPSRHKGAAVKELLISMACVLKSSLRGYDLPCRLNSAEFGVLLRQVTAADMTAIAHTMLTSFTIATQRTLRGDRDTIEFATAIYPYDAESVEGLFTYAAGHWLRYEGEGDPRHDSRSLEPPTPRQGSNQPILNHPP